jgi:PAS domain S-box-containing protein
VSDELLERCLILAPNGRDASVARDMLAEAGLRGDVVPSVEQLVLSLEKGAGCGVVTEESLTGTDLRPLSDWLSAQPEWSDFPFVLLTQRGGGLERNPSATRYLEILGNVTFLERPFHPTTFVSLAQSALRGRRRQYEARSRLIALRESEARFRTLFDTMDEGFCIIEFIDGPHGPLSDYVHVQANAAYERHAGIANVVGQKVREMVPDEADGWVERYRNVLVTGEPIRFEQELEATHRHLELAAFRVEPAERCEVAVIFQDVTERKQSEIALRELNETLERRVSEAVAERAAALAQLHEAQKIETLGQLTGGVAHDFNNLLTPITGALDLLYRQTGEDDARTRRLLSNALQAADRAKTLLQRLLGFARRQALQTEPVDLAELLVGMRDLISSAVGPTIQLQLRCDSDLPPAIVDPNQLELAILNLCVNARDAMPHGGHLTILAEGAAVGPTSTPRIKPGFYLRISVIDAGVGMDPETLARAIEPFYSTKEVGRGTGLGLSMVHGLAAQLGGGFHLTSAPGAGTRVDLYLPVADKGVIAERRPTVEPARHVGRPLKVLLIDDEELVRAATAEMIRDLGHEVVDASGAAEGLALLSRGLTVDVVVTDYMMPGIDGGELARRVAATHPEVSVLLITGYTGPADDVLHLPRLSKPFGQAELASALASLFAGDDKIVRLHGRKPRDGS